MNYEPPKGGYALIKHLELIEPSILCFLLFDIPTDRLLIPADGRHMIAFCPEMLIRKILFAAEIVPSDVYSAFTLYITYDLRYSNRLILRIVSHVFKP